MRNLAEKKSACHSDLRDKNLDKHHTEKVLGKSCKKNKSKKTPENTAEKSLQKTLKPDIIEEIPENTSPVCYANTKEVREDYKTE